MKKSNQKNRGAYPTSGSKSQKPSPGGGAKSTGSKGGNPKASQGGKANRGTPASAGAPRHESRSQNASASQGRGGPEVRQPRDKARWVVGIHSCAETLKVRPKQIRELWVREDYLSSEQLRELAALAIKHRIELKPKSVGQLDQIGSGHQGVALAVMQSPELNWKKLDGETTHVVMILDGLEDPNNLGSILRTAWLTGVSAVLTPEDRAVGLTPTVCKIASGGAEHVAVDTHVNLPSAMQQLKDLGFWIYGLSEKGTRSPWEFQLPKKVAWVVGSEGSGLRITTERACDELVRIPQVATGSSYNASIAAAMALAETCRQLKQPE